MRTGLTSSQVTKNREKYGSNKLPEKKLKTGFQFFMETFEDRLNQILLAMMIVFTVLAVFGQGSYSEPIGVAVVLLAIAFIGMNTGLKSQKSAKELKDRTSIHYCNVIRDGKVEHINSNDLVVGDLVIIQSGEAIYADGYLVEGNVKVDNSVLNGESDPCKKTPWENEDSSPIIIGGKRHANSNDYVDSYSLFAGTTVTDGEGKMVVTNVGVNTVNGQTISTIDEIEETKTSLEIQLDDLAGQISKFGYIGAAIIVAALIVTNIIQIGGIAEYLNIGWIGILKNVLTIAVTALTIIVAAVPEGLPLMISLVLMQNTSKMLDHNVLVRKAEGIETAGSLNILFSDKTGTITKGMLEVVDFFTGDGNSIDIAQLSKHSKVKGLVDLAIGKNTQSMFDASHKVIGGNATDQALMKFLGEETFKTLENSSEYKITKQQSFNSANKFSQARIDSTGKTFYKGAPEKLLANAVKYLDADGNICTMDNAILNRKIDELAAKAMRVLAFGYSEKDMVENSINDDIVIIGLVGIRDDVRPEAKEAIREVQGAGIQVVMITGDRLETAVAIAKDAGLLKGGSDRALSSAQLNEMSDEEVKKIIPNIRVIARALPTDKSRMVRLCQEMNLVVGMTGDGVNDSPALKRADVGFAMGSGTEAAKEAGKIVILDDNFKSIKDAILYGRTIYHNILKFCKFQLVINVAAVLVSAIAPFFGVDEPLKVTHLLFVNLVMDGLGAMMLGNEPAKEEYMAEAPRKRDESIVSKKMMGQILTMGIWLTVVSFIYLKVPFFVNLFANEEQHLTGYFVLFIVAALFNGFNVRDDGFAIFAGLNENKDFIKVFLIIIIVQALLVNAAIVPLAPFQWIGEMFSCVPFGIKGWIAVVLLACTMIPADMVRKLCVNK